MPRYNVETSAAFMDALEEARNQIVIASEPLDGWLHMQEVNPDDPNEVEWQTEVWNNARAFADHLRKAFTITEGEERSEQIVDEFADFEPSVERNLFAVCYVCNCLFDDHEQYVTEGDGRTRHAHCDKADDGEGDELPTEMVRWSGEVIVEITDIDRDTFIGTVTTPIGARQVACSQPSEDHFAEIPADTTPEGIDTAAYLLIDMAIEADAEGDDKTLISGLAIDEGRGIDADNHRAVDDSGYTTVSRSFKERGEAVGS